MKKIDRSRDDIAYRKWIPIIESKFQFSNITTNRLICIYCEWYSSDPESNDPDELANRLLEIREEVLSTNKIGIVGQFFNPASGLIEFLLESGEFFSPNKLEYELSSENKIRIFGIDFIRDLDPQEFRTKQLDKLL